MKQIEQIKKRKADSNLLKRLKIAVWIISGVVLGPGIISNNFASLTIIGFTSIIFIHLIVNMGMTVGLLPVTGLPAPFLSYGGSFLVSCMLILALTSNIINHHT